MKSIKYISTISLVCGLSACVIQPPLSPNTVQAGCATLVSVEEIKDPSIAPEFQNPFEKGKSSVGAGEIATALSGVPGIGLVAAAAIAAGTAMTAEAVVNNANQVGNVGSPTAPQWKGVKLITVKPDFGDAYSIRYLGLKSASAGSRVILSIDKTR